MTLLGLLLSALVAIAPNDNVVLTLAGGESIEGRVARLYADGLVVTTSSGRRDVAVALVERAEVNGRIVDSMALSEELDARLQLEQSRISPNAFAPHPILPTTSSFFVPGSGQAILGDWPSARGYLVADIVLLGLGSYLFFVQQDRGAALPLFGLDLIFRTASASEAYRASRRRRALLDRRGSTD